MALPSCISSFRPAEASGGGLERLGQALSDLNPELKTRVNCFDPAWFHWNSEFMHGITQVAVRCQPSKIETLTGKRIISPPDLSGYAICFKPGTFATISLTRSSPIRSLARVMVSRATA